MSSILTVVLSALVVRHVSVSVVVVYHR